MVRRKLATFLVAITGVIALANGLVFGQEFSATLSGVVHDANGAVVPGVSVTAKHTDSGLTRMVLTNETGSYRIPAVPVGTYEVTAELAGFKQVVQRGITLAVAQEAVVNLTLEVGDVQQEVTVTSEAAIVNTTMSSTSGLIRNDQISSLPLNGRSYLDLLTLNAGAISNRSNTTNQDAPAYSIAGNRPDQLRFTLNGMDYVGNNPLRGYTAPQGISGSLLGVDAVQEFNVLEHTYGAEYGKRAGAQVTIVTKSGTNQWHGSVFEYLRNKALDSRNYFDVANAPNPTPVPAFQRNQFGGSMGGPIRRDKMFVFGSYEGFQQRLGVTDFGYVPDPQVRQGLLPNASGQYVLAPNLQSGILPFFQYWPLPNGPEFLQNGQPTGSALYSANPKSPITENYELGRFDYNISRKDTVSSNFTVDRGTKGTPSGGFVTNLETDMYTYSAQETHIFSPTLLNVATFGFSKAYGAVQTASIAPFPKNLLFLSGSYGINPGTIGITGSNFLSPSGSLGIGGLNPVNIDRRNYSVSDDLKLTKGIHNLSMGGWFLRTVHPQFGVTAKNAGSAVYPSLLSFLQDRPTLFQVPSKPLELVLDYKQAAWYFQDEMKLRPNLSVRLGLRDEMSARPTEENGHASNYWFGPDGILMTQPVIGNTQFQKNNAKALWQPRVGVVWDPSGAGKWAVRAGFGIHNDLQDNLINRLQNQPFSGLLAFLNQPLLSIIPVSSDLPAPPQCTVVGQTNPPCVSYSPVNVDQNMHIPTVQQWSLTLERQLAQDLKVEASYVGSQSYHLPQNTDANSIQPLTCQNPAGCLAGGVLAASQRSTVPLGTYYVPVGPRPNPLLGSAQALFFFGTSSYNAMNLSVTKRMSRGLTFKGNYTWGKALDTNSATLGGAGTNEPINILTWYNRKLSKGPASFSLLHQFSANYGYQLPFGNGKRFGSGATGWVDKLIGGWQWNGIFTAASGFPLTPLVGSNQSGNGITTNPDVPNLNPNFKGNPILGVDAFKKTGRYFDPNAFSLPSGGTFGNAGRSQFRGPGFWNIDTSIFKRIPLKEQLNLQFRTEFFNVLNHANFTAPTLAVFSGGAISPTAGVLTNTVGGGNGRQIQFALRLEF